MNYKKFDYSQFRPTGKQNCICWLEDGTKITAYYHQLKSCMIGLYDEWQNKELEGVKEWCYAILSKRTSNDLFPDMVDEMGLKDGLEVFRTQFSCLDNEKQDRLFNEVDLTIATIKRWFSEQDGYK